MHLTNLAWSSRRDSRLRLKRKKLLKRKKRKLTDWMMHQNASTRLAETSQACGTWLFTALFIGALLFNILFWRKLFRYFLQLFKVDLFIIRFFIKLISLITNYIPYSNYLWVKNVITVKFIFLLNNVFIVYELCIIFLRSSICVCSFCFLACWLPPFSKNSGFYN